MHLFCFACASSLRCFRFFVYLCSLSFFFCFANSCFVSFRLFSFLFICFCILCVFRCFSCFCFISLPFGFFLFRFVSLLQSGKRSQTEITIAQQTIPKHPKWCQNASKNRSGPEMDPNWAKRAPLFFLDAFVDWFLIDCWLNFWLFFGWFFSSCWFWDHPERSRKISDFSNPPKSSRIGRSIDPVRPLSRFGHQKYPPHPLGCRACQITASQSSIYLPLTPRLPKIDPSALPFSSLDDPFTIIGWFFSASFFASIFDIHFSLFLRFLINFGSHFGSILALCFDNFPSLFPASF